LKLEYSLLGEFGIVSILFFTYLLATKLNKNTFTQVYIYIYIYFIFISITFETLDILVGFFIYLFIYI
jgi:hypothetical protein